jgi:predicted hydrocarbon binding protein
VDALLPLSLLEAVRLVDAPDGDLEAELVPELRNKRLGLSETVYAQVRRYNEAVRRNQRIPFDEAVALAKLVGRRTDAEVVFRSAGRFLANEAYAQVAPLSRTIMSSLPGMLARPVALRHMRRIAERYLGGEIARVGSSVLLSVPGSVTLETGPRQSGCTFQEATLRELLKLLVDGAGAVDHVRCASRGEGVCEWRAEWRAAGR